LHLEKFSLKKEEGLGSVLAVSVTGRYGYRGQKTSRHAHASGKETIILGMKSSGFHSRFLSPVGRRENKSLEVLSLKGRHWQPHQKALSALIQISRPLHKYLLEPSDWPIRHK
jgi:hypothetical protein